MKKETAILLVEHSDELRLRNDYSGRGMFGKETYAVVGCLDDLLEGVANLGLSYGNAYGDDEEMQDALSECARGFRRDSMGRTEMVFY